MRTTREARNHGKHAGIAVYMPKGTTSMETVETKSYGKNLFFLWSNSPNFWVAPRIMSSRGELTKGGPPDWWLNEDTIPPHRKYQHVAK